MHTLKQIADKLREIPASAAWYLSDISEFKGKQELYTRQSPQKLKVLREHALIESAVSSNRIEGVEIDRKRIGTVVFGKPLLKDPSTCLRRHVRLRQLMPAPGRDDTACSQTFRDCGLSIIPE